MFSFVTFSFDYFHEWTPHLCIPTYSYPHLDSEEFHKNTHKLKNLLTDNVYIKNSLSFGTPINSSYSFLSFFVPSLGSGFLVVNLKTIASFLVVFLVLLCPVHGPLSSFRRRTTMSRSVPTSPVITIEL